VPKTEECDVVIVGASLAGCATAILLGRQGLRVALVDKHGDEEAFKRLCGHYIQSSATATVERLGLADAIEAAGGVRNGIDIWTRWGVIDPRTPPEERTRGFSLRRKKLDPLIRRAAADLPTVDYRPRLKAVALDDRGPRSASVDFESPDGARLRLKGRLVVGADGRNSAVARLAGVKERRSRNKRFCYAAYFTDVTLPSTDQGRMWVCDPDVVIAAPQDEGLTVLAAFPHRRELGRFEADRPGALMSTLQGLPGLDLTHARQADKILGYKDYELISRTPVAGSSIALVGDAALSSDPVMAVGCGWAIESAGWLADSVSTGLEAGEDLGPGLRGYRRRHRRGLGAHHLMNRLNAQARPLDPFRRMLFSAGVSDPVVAQRMNDFGERTIQPRELLTPAVLGRAAMRQVAR
jgi:menaquinone-9 beta-reductase